VKTIIEVVDETQIRSKLEERIKGPQFPFLRLNQVRIRENDLQKTDLSFVQAAFCLSQRTDTVSEDNFLFLAGRILETPDFLCLDIAENGMRLPESTEWATMLGALVMSKGNITTEVKTDPALVADIFRSQEFLFPAPGLGQVGRSIQEQILLAKSFVWTLEKAAIQFASILSLYESEKEVMLEIASRLWPYTKFGQLLTKAHLQ